MLSWSFPPFRNNLTLTRNVKKALSLDVFPDLENFNSLLKKPVLAEKLLMIFKLLPFAQPLFRFQGYETSGGKVFCFSPRRLWHFRTSPVALYWDGDVEGTQRLCACCWWRSRIFNPKTVFNTVDHLIHHLSDFLYKVSCVVLSKSEFLFTRSSTMCENVWFIFSLVSLPCIVPSTRAQTHSS